MAIYSCAARAGLGSVLRMECTCYPRVCYAHTVGATILGLLDPRAPAV